jgi:hypothetical protein
MITNLFEKTIKDFVCLSLIEMLESNAAIMLSFINSSMTKYFPMISQVLKISVDSIPRASAFDMHMLIGPDPNVEGYYAGPKRELQIKFPDIGPLGMKLDVVVEKSGSGIAKAVITGTKEGSQAERVFRDLDNNLVAAQLQMSTIVGVNGKRTLALDEEQLMALLKNPKRPLMITFRLSDDVYNALRAEHAETVTKLRKGSAKVGSSKINASVKAKPAMSQLQTSKYRKLKVTRVSFVDGPLGLKLKETKSCGGAVIITGFVRPEGVNAGTKLQAETLGVLEPGMIMLGVENTVVFGQPFEKVMEIIKRTPRPMNMLFVRSPDLQVVFPSYIARVTDKDLTLGMIEGYVMITANNLGALIKPGQMQSNNIKSVSAVSTDETIFSSECNCDKLLPGMVILQVC